MPQIAMRANPHIGAPAEMSWANPGWKVTIASSLASTAGFSSILIYSFGAFIKPLSTEFGWSRQTISTAFACASFTLGICSPGLGFLLDRYGPHRVILPCIVILALAFASLSQLQSLPQLFCTFILIGAIGNATAQMGYTPAICSWFHQRRGSALAVLMVGSSLGMIAMPVITHALLAHNGWRLTYAMLGALPLLIAFPLVALFVRENKTRPPQQTVPAQPAPVETASFLFHKAFWILLATLVLGAMSTTGTITQLAALLTDQGIKASDAAYAVAAVGAASLAGRLITGWLLDILFAPRVGMALLFVTAAGLYLLSVAHTLTAGVAASILIGFSMGGESDVTPYLLARYFGVRRLGVLYGWTWTAYAIAAALGSVLLGRVFDRTGTYASLLVMFSLACLIAGTLMIGMPAYQTEQHLETERDEIQAA